MATPLPKACIIGAGCSGFTTAKRETARFFFARILPRTQSHKTAIESGAAPLMTLHAEDFGA